MGLTKDLCMEIGEFCSAFQCFVAMILEPVENKEKGCMQWDYYCTDHMAYLLSWLSDWSKVNLLHKNIASVFHLHRKELHAGKEAVSLHGIQIRKNSFGDCSVLAQTSGLQVLKSRVSIKAWDVTVDKWLINYSYYPAFGFCHYLLLILMNWWTVTARELLMISLLLIFDVL